jgi:nucleoid-associated protein YgaU
MGLLDFFKKGQEKPAQAKQPPTPVNKPDTSVTGTPAATQTTGQREYVIKKGDTLSKIAKSYYGKPGEWKKIYEANKSVINNPDLIYPGQKIIIP